ncbi:unnamed protein product [Acanthoscelides obtectus]|uniref:Uncharacterized protein n=1 Tax=Acanthoscelides obtectus TaxID=200917 RepID=A0A9P0K0A0_ACAOB|nr:unnamed protein product [Acanthoscelides obtectus]CAK1633820.1 hypothetical protein AOBTE_LOCUS8409 [Acanthoscelides obtectus]
MDIYILVEKGLELTLDANGPLCPLVVASKKNTSLPIYMGSNKSPLTLLAKKEKRETWSSPDRTYRPARRKVIYRNNCLTPQQQLLLPLRNGSFLTVAGHFAGVSKSTASKTVRRFLKVLTTNEYLNESEMKCSKSRVEPQLFVACLGPVIIITMAGLVCMCSPRFFFVLELVSAVKMKTPHRAVTSLKMQSVHDYRTVSKIFHKELVSLNE